MNYRGMEMAICIECETEIYAYDKIDLEFARYCHDARYHDCERRTVDMRLGIFST